MKKKFTESLDSRLLKYSLAAGAVLFGVKNADSQVWGTTDGRSISVSNDTLQINFNGHKAFSLEYTFQLGYLNSFLINNQTANAQWIKGTGGAKAIGSNYSIKSTATSRFSNASIRFARSVNGSFTYGSSFKNVDKYLGVRFKISGSYYLGWIKIHVYANGNGIKLISYAYNQTAGQSITTNGTLPVELTTLSANNLGNKVELLWNTATEVNNYGFEIQRSVDSGQESVNGSQSSIDNRQWSKVGFVKGSGNSNSPKNYSFIDDNPPSGTVEYRLKQIDNNGNFKYSQIVTVISLPTKFELWQNYPNPFNPTTTIQYAVPKAEHITLKVYDELGNEVTTLVNENKEAGQYRVSFNGSNFASGIYFYRITAGDFTEVKKLMLLK